MYVPEFILQYIWQFKKLPMLSLQTTKGEQIRVVESGILNTNSGPDFLNARLIIGLTEWAGTIEIHYRTSDWDLHGHQTDKSYNNVILHVVYHDNKEVKRENGSLLHTLVLEPHLAELNIERFNAFFSQVHPIPCFSQLRQLDSFILTSQILRCALERIQIKSDIFLKALAQNKGSWEETAYQLLFKSFGSQLNGLPFEMLARSVPFKILKRLKFQPESIQALLFGQAGLLTKALAPHEAFESYGYLRIKYGLNPMTTEAWKFMRTRPSNFPTLRLAQLSKFLIGKESLFEFLMQERNIEEWKIEFSKSSNIVLWNKYLSGRMGKSAIYSVLINAVAVLQYSYGRYLNVSSIKQRAIDLLENIPPEDNKLVRIFDLQKEIVQTCMHSQGILQLFQQYCSKKRCLNCKVGFKLLS